MSATTYLGRVGGELAEAFGYLTSPARVDAEIRHYAAAVAAGDTSPATAQLLADWRAIQEAQRRIVGGAPGPQQQALDPATMTPAQQGG